MRQEECIDVAGREAAHEKEIHSAMQISQSWEDLTIEAEGLSFKDSESASLQFKIESRPITKRILDPLSINLSVSGPTMYSSPSPTRTGFGQRQCYSPGVHAATWKNNLSPSPIRKAFATRYIYFFIIKLLIIFLISFLLFHTISYLIEIILL